MHDEQSTRSRNRIACLVDTDNVSPKHADAIFTEIAKHGEAVLKRAYGDFASPGSKGWTEKLARHGLVPVHSVAGAKGKNSTDISMVIDAMDLLHSRVYDAFFIVSSDSDFTRLVQRLREGGAETYVIGEAKASEGLKKSCRRFFLINNLTTGEDGEDDVQPELALPDDPSRRPVSEAAPTIHRAYERLRPDHGDGWVPLRKLGQVILNTDPDWDPRSFGIERLGDLAEKTGRFQIKQVQGRGWWVKARDKAPEAKPSATRRTGGGDGQRSQQRSPSEGVERTVSRTAPAKRATDKPVAKRTPRSAGGQPRQS